MDSKTIREQTTAQEWFKHAQDWFNYEHEPTMVQVAQRVMQWGAWKWCGCVEASVGVQMQKIRPTAGSLEHMIMQEKDWPPDVPAEAVRLYKEETQEGVPTAISLHPTEGWFVIQTSGQGPYIIWP